MKTQIDLSIVIPAYQEEKRLGKTLVSLADFIKNDPTLNKLEIEVIIVAADTTDQTHKVALEHKKLFKDYHLLKPGKKLGKGRDVQFGMLRAKGNLVIFMDADMATPLKYLSKFYKEALQGPDVVIATRNLRKHHPSMGRRLVSYTGNLVFRIAGGVWVEDSQCGFKLFKKNAAKICFSRLNILGWGFDMEVLAIARVNKLSIKSIRVDDWRSMPNGTFAEGVLKNSLVSLMDLGLIFRNRLSGKYKADPKPQ